MFSWLKKLFTRSVPDFEDDFPVELPLPVAETINLDSFSLGHSRVGQSTSEKDSFHTDEPMLWIKNPDQGIELGIKDGILEFVFITTAAYQQPVISKGQEYFLTPELSLDTFISHFGPPYFNSKDDEETLLFYAPIPGEIEIQAEFTNGCLSHLLITSESIMANDEQRLAYGVDKPWPPEN